jgi:hypothetical protein
MSRWASLLAVQEHDTRADQLNHRLQTLPIRSELVQLEDNVLAVEGRLADAQRRSANGRTKPRSSSTRAP